ncbi:MAG: hypothetical protein SynsKO_24670 [Synoicihabitans sp.]
MVMSVIPARAYIMRELTYAELFERADVVVIATPVETTDSSIVLKLQIEQSNESTDLIKTVETKFELAVLLKGTLDATTFRFLHLSRKDERRVLVFGSVGSFFVDFHPEQETQNSYLLFMTRGKDGTFYPAWRPMEGSRAIIPIMRDKFL